MLTADYIFKVARLDDQTGEPAAGFLHDGDTNLDAQAAPVESAALPENGVVRPDVEPGYCLRLVREIDAITGEPRLTQQ